MENELYWNSLISTLPNPHFLQTHEWAQVKAAGGWQPLYAVWDADGTVNYASRITEYASAPKAAALILKKTVIRRGLAARLCILYCPKGPNLDWSDAPLRRRVLDDLQGLARQQGAIFLKLDPDIVLGTGLPGAEDAVTEPGGEAVRADLSRRGWQFSQDQIQFRNTVLLDVSASEDEMLARMKQKTRYNTRLASKKGVSVRAGTEADFPMLYRMYAETAARDGFMIREEHYYQTVWRTFGQASMPFAQPLIAEVDGEPVAAVFLFAFAGRAYYVYGMSREAHREKMPAYLLQWEAMKWAKARGCRIYDLWGAPDVFDESDAMWGVFRFKEGLGGYVARTLGAWDFAPNPLWYAMYTRLMPKVLDFMRLRGKAKTQRIHEEHEGH
ncbi:MAG: peptidoglycan bridge formation glycyltransferase FemA/FemB family protein [Anaerolineales bacterium]